CATCASRRSPSSTSRWRTEKLRSSARGCPSPSNTTAKPGLFTAVVRISGTGRLADFRERVRWLMVRDPEAEDYSEHHGEGFLEYRFTPRRGIPFPAFTEASGEFPELRVEAEWERAGARGRAVIENGRLVEQAQAREGEGAIDVEVGDDGRLVLGMVCRPAGGACVGYAATAERHTYFRW